MRILICTGLNIVQATDSIHSTAPKAKQIKVYRKHTEGNEVLNGDTAPVIYT